MIHFQRKTTHLKVEGRKNWIIRIAQCWFVHFLVFRTLFHRYISPKVKPWFVQDIKMAAVFCDVHQYFSWLIFMYRKSGLMFYWWRRSAYEKRRSNDFSSKIDLRVALCECLPKFSVFYELLKSSIWMFDVTNRRYNKQIYMSSTIYLTI